jgi:hypothetical protein
MREELWDQEGAEWQAASYRLNGTSRDAQRAWDTESEISHLSRLLSDAHNPAGLPIDWPGLTDHPVSGYARGVWQTRAEQCVFIPRSLQTCCSSRGKLGQGFANCTRGGGELGKTSKL